MTVTFTALPRHSGKALYTVMRRELFFSASLTRRLKAAGAIRMAGAPVFTTHTLLPGETFSFDLAAAEPPCGLLPERGVLEILYENEGLLAVNKPAGVLIHPTHTKYTGTLANLICGYLAERGQAPVCHAVNRLDRDTSGAVLFAKNSYAMERAAAALAEPAAGKEYLALVYGRFSPDRGIIDLPISRPDARDQLRIVAPDGQRAVTRYETLRAGSFSGIPFSMLRLKLETGRTHQIRVHCLTLGHPVLGDGLYRTDASAALSQRLGLSTQALHAERLSFTDFLTGEAVTVSAPIRREEIIAASSRLWTIDLPGAP